MKSVKNFLFAALLVSSLAFNTFAGDIDLPGAPVPPPPRMTVAEDPSVTGTNTEETEAVSSESSDYLFYEALAALLSVYY